MLHRNTEANHVYYNVRVQNGDPSGQNKVCEYRETRNVPIIDMPQDYFLTCVRFQVPTSTIPLLIVPIQPYPNTDVSKTIYSVSLSYGGKTAQQYVIWNPNEKLSKTSYYISPKRQITKDTPFTNASDSYYYCRSYLHMMNLVNTAFAAAFTALGGMTTLPVGATAPYYTYDAPTKLFTLNAQKANYDVTNPSYIAIYINNDLYTLFGAMNHVVINNNNSDEEDKQILIKDEGNNTVNGIINYSQEFSTLVGWVGFKSIVITSGTLPVIDEGIPTSQDYFSNTNVNANGQPSFLKIVSDYDALFDDLGGADFVNSFQYTSTSEYRLIDLVGTQPITTFDLKVWWVDQFGGLHELLITPNESATFKFLFRRKAFNLGILAKE
jgi:hypothetical protein